MKVMTLPSASSTAALPEGAVPSTGLHTIEMYIKRTTVPCPATFCSTSNPPTQHRQHDLLPPQLPIKSLARRRTPPPNLRTIRGNVLKRLGCLARRNSNPRPNPRFPLAAFGRKARNLRRPCSPDRIQMDHQQRQRTAQLPSTDVHGHLRARGRVYCLQRGQDACVPARD